MEKAAPPDTLVVDGDKLKQAREARGMSVHDMASSVTLSREQVRALEDGGNLPFYTAAHKRLALRKYASALGIPLSDVIIDTEEARPASAEPAAADAVAVADAPGTPAELRLAAAERNARLRRRLLASAVATAILLAMYAKQRGTPDTGAPPAAVEASAALDSPAPAPEPVPATAAAEPAANPALQPAPQPAPQPDSPARANAATEATACTLPPAAGVPVWSPPYQRKPDLRVFLISRTAVEVCIADASGRPALITLKPNAGHAFAGKPPYLVRADGLAALDIYLQGMRARVPADAQALRLVPTTVMRAADDAVPPSADQSAE